MSDLSAVSAPDCRRAGADTVPGRPEATAHDLLNRYAEPHRRYHTGQHLTEMLSALDAIDAATGPAEPADRLRTRLAAWFHDAVYDPRADENEQRSADLARSVLTSLGATQVVLDDVAALIMSTRAHRAEGPDRRREVTRRVLDADLWILSAPETRFDEYCTQIRQEYRFVDTPTYRDARSAVITEFLQRPRLYATDYAHLEWTEPARDNLRREQRRLN